MACGGLARVWNDPGPDRGWSWVILGCAWVFNASTFGFASMGGAGVLFTEFLRVFNVSREEAMWPFSTAAIVQCVSATLAGILSTSGHLSIRTLFLISGTLASLSLTLCFWASSITWITVVFGTLFGITMGVGNTNTGVIVCQYFKKYQTTANGVALSGIPVAGFILPILLEFLIRTYSLRGCMLILGGLMANLIVCSLLLRPRTADHFPVLDTSLKVNKFLEASDVSKTENENRNTCKPLTDSNNLETISDCAGNINTCKQLEQSNGVQKKDGGESECTVLIKSNNLNVKEKTSNQVPKKTLNDFVQLYSSILSQPIFYLITLHAIICVNVMGALAMILIDFVMDKGITRDLGVIMLSVFAISDLIGKLFSGSITDRKWATLAQMSVCSNVIMGAGLVTLCFTNNVVAIFGIVIVIGLAEGSASTLINILYRKYFGLSRLAMSISLRLLINGVVIFLRPLIIGGFRDKLGSYEYYFYLLGGGTMLTGLSWLGEPWAVKQKEVKPDLPLSNVQL